MDKNWWRVVVGIDFGTTYSGFAYAHVSNPTVAIDNKWSEHSDALKTDTVLRYDSNYENVECWGYSALTKNPGQDESTKPVELFKLHLCNKLKSDIPYLPPNLDYRKAITDYLREMGKLIKKTLETRWCGIELHKIFYILAVPAEFPENSKDILRQCALDAKLISKKDSNKLQFTTEPEAAAIHCLDVIEDLENLIEKSFLVVDCGGGTVDLTVRKLLNNYKLEEGTIRTGDLCGGIYVDKEFIKFLKTKVGDSEMELLKKDHYGQYQYLVREFCREVKLPFTGIEEEYNVFELNIKEICPALKECVTGLKKGDLERKEWIIKIGFQDAKKMFDPVIDKIIKLIEDQLKQLNADNTCSTIFLVGGFSESKYLQKMINDKFSDRVERISIPKQPVFAVARGALKYGVNEGFIKNRVLKHTYGRSVLRPYDENIDPIERKRDSGKVLAFKTLAKKGTRVEVGRKFSQVSTPENSNQTAMWYQLMITEKDDVKYCDEEGVEVLGECTFELLNIQPDTNREVYFELCFGKTEIEAYARDEHNKKEHRIKFNYSK